MAEFVVRWGDAVPPCGRTVYRLPPVDEGLSRKKRDALMKRVGDEVTARVVDEGLPFEAVVLFMRKALASGGAALVLYDLRSGRDREPCGEWEGEGTR